MTTRCALRTGHAGSHLFIETRRASGLGECQATPSHYVHWESNTRPDGTAQAVCGAIVDDRMSSSEPSCPTCQNWLEEDSAMLASLVAWDRSLQRQGR